MFRIRLRRAGVLRSLTLWWSALGHTRRRQLARIANAPLTILLISAVLIVVGPECYSDRQDQNLRRRERDAAVRTLDLEIAERVRHLNLEFADNLSMFYNGRLSEVPDERSFHALFPEYQARSLRSLLLQLEDLVEGRRTVEIRAVIDATERIELQPNEAADTSAVRTYLELLRAKWGSQD
jgi:hypothetical protein